jgi:hypothetical protein
MLTRYSTLSSADITQLIAPVMTKAITTMNIFPTPLDRPFYLLRIYHIFTVSNLRECEHSVNKNLAVFLYHSFRSHFWIFFLGLKKETIKSCVLAFSATSLNRLTRWYLSYSISLHHGFVLDISF